MPLVVFLIVLFMPVLVLGQAGAASIRLEVKDGSGAPMAVTGRLENLSSGAVRQFRSGSDGRHSIDGLAYGRYRLQVFADGFVTQRLELNLRTGADLPHRITMQVGTSVYRVDVLGTAPLPGVDRALGEIPAPMQSATSADIESSGALNLPEFLNRRLNGVFLNEIQGNPFQADLNYRGYTASPLLGTPQGISIYMDGVRLNQPFGDVVSWDLMPRNVIAGTTLVPGSNPLFGLNTLGGAVAMETKDGGKYPGTVVQFSSGSFGRKMADLEHGGTNGKGFDWYGASSLFFEDGWRQSSPSNVRQFFGKLGWHDTDSSLGLSVSYANNSLVGNGLQEQRFLERDYSSIYTKPDITRNRSPFLNLRGRRSLPGSWSVSGNVYYRHIRSSTLNGDINEESLDQALYQPSAADQQALREAGYTGFPASGANAANTPFPFWRCIAKVLQRDEPEEMCNGLLNRSRGTQHNFGGAGQMNWAGAIGGHRNQFTAGGAFDGNRVGFLQSTQLGYLNPDRSVTGLPAFADAEPFDTRVDLKGRIETASVYATDTLSLGSAWNLTFSGRYNRTVVDNRDQILPQGGLGSLNGRHVFVRFNPAFGATVRLGGQVNAYAGYSEGNRAPSSIELGCADPNSPCKLPNSMAGDPPLNQVVTRTVETGLRGGLGENWKWNAGYFRAGNRDDILFVASEQTGFGYFKNFGRTRRQGLETGMNGRVGRFTMGGVYTLLDASFRSPEAVNGVGNSSNVEGTIEIEPGARIPLIPRQMGKAYLDLQVTKTFSLNLGVVAVSSMIARGNENNRHKADGRYYLGPGVSPGYGVANLGARYQLMRRVQLWVQINNLLNRRYYSAAQLGPTGFTAAGNFVARPFAAIEGEYPLQQATFYAPGAPRGAWGGLRFQF